MASKGIDERLFAGAAWPLLLILASGCDAGSRAGQGVGTVDAAGAGAGRVEAVDDAGRVVRLDGPATRIVSLLPAATETLVAMGGADRLVARTDYDGPELAHLPSVGGGLTPSLERIASLHPDLVVAWEEAGVARIRPRLEELGIPVFAAETRDTADIYATVARLGHLAGLDAPADSLARWMRAELAAVAASVAGRAPPGVVYLVGVDPPIVAGPKVFIGEILSLAGGRNLFAELTEASPQMSLEEIVRRRPQIVLFPASGPGSTAASRIEGSPGWSELARSGETRFEPLPADLLHRPGPSIVEAAWILRDAVHPDLAGVR